MCLNIVSLGCAGQVVHGLPAFLLGGSAEQGSFSLELALGFQLAPNSLQLPPLQRTTAASCPHQRHSVPGLQWVEMDSHMSPKAQTLEPLYGAMASPFMTALISETSCLLAPKRIHVPSLCPGKLTGGLHMASAAQPLSIRPQRFPLTPSSQCLFSLEAV